MIYRVVLDVGARKELFDFSAGVNALNFASDLIYHRATNPGNDGAELNFAVSINIIKEAEDDGEQED